MKTEDIEKKGYQNISVLLYCGRFSQRKSAVFLGRRIVRKGFRDEDKSRHASGSVAEKIVRVRQYLRQIFEYGVGDVSGLSVVDQKPRFVALLRREAGYALAGKIVIQNRRVHFTNNLEFSHPVP